MQEHIERFLTHLATERGLTPNTVAAYRNDLTQLRAFLQSPRAARVVARSGENGHARVEPAAVTREVVIDFFLHLKEKGYAAATIARKVAAVKSLFGYLHATGAVGVDPVADLDSPEVKKPLPHALSVAEVDALLAQARRRHGPDGLRDRAMLELLYSTGMRVSEMVMLDLDDVELNEGLVRCIGRAGRMRVIPVAARARDSLAEYLARGRPSLSRAGLTDDALFLNQRGQRLTRQGFWLIMKTLARDSGVASAVTPHTLRHSFAAHRLSEGVDLHHLQQILGHANISTTQIYKQVRAQLRNGEATRWEARDAVAADG